MEIKVERNQKEAGLVSSVDYCSHEEREEEVAECGNEIHTLTFQHHFLPAHSDWEKIFLISMNDFVWQYCQGQ